VGAGLPGGGFACGDWLVCGEQPQNPGEVPQGHSTLAWATRLQGTLDFDLSGLSPRKLQLVGTAGLASMTCSPVACRFVALSLPPWGSGAGALQGVGWTWWDRCVAFFGVGPELDLSPNDGLPRTGPLDAQGAHMLQSVGGFLKSLSGSRNGRLHCRCLGV